MKTIITISTAALFAVIASLDSMAQEPAPGSAPAANPNSFNRLMKPTPKVNPAPMQDGVHDTANPGTAMLQAPAPAFDTLNKSKHGNHVDWVTSLDDGKISPRWDRIDDTMQPIEFDLNIVRVVKGSMPDVVYPHKSHTKWLDCSNCHPDIFIPQKGANQISMASIMLGEKCGVCHGKVAFPVTTSTCTLCHSQPKDTSDLKRSSASLKP